MDFQVSEVLHDLYEGSEFSHNYDIGYIIIISNNRKKVNCYWGCITCNGMVYFYICGKLGIRWYMRLSLLQIILWDNRFQRQRRKENFLKFCWRLRSRHVRPAPRDPFHAWALLTTYWRPFTIYYYDQQRQNLKRGSNIMLTNTSSKVNQHFSSYSVVPFLCEFYFITVFTNAQQRILLEFLCIATRLARAYSHRAS